MKLSRKLNLSFIVTILISIITISIISNIMINNKFENYLVDERKTKFDKIYENINTLYIDREFEMDEMDLIHYAIAEDINIKIKDSEDRVIFDSDRTRGISMPRGMMNRNRRNAEANYLEESYTLRSDSNEELGTLIIGYIDNSYLSESALIFRNTLSKSIFISSFITIILGVLISMYLSRSLTLPLVHICDTAIDIRQGNLDSRSNINTNTLEIKDLSDSINFLGETLSKEEISRKAYASDISHELRTPLTTLKTHLEAMIDGIWEANEEHLNILLVEVDRLSKLTDDLRDSFDSKAYNIDLNKTKFNISLELKDIITAFTPIYYKDNHLITSSIEDNIELILDKDKFNQIMNNLLSNSKRYLGNDGRVHIDLIKEKKNIIIKVKDNGIGIQAKDMPYIFDRFYRVDSSRNKDTGGSGLGLSIVKGLVEAHGGSIQINSIYKEGTEVAIILPCTQ